MTEAQKKWAIVGGVIIIALLLLLNKKTGITNVNQEQTPAINVSIPSLNLPDRSGYPINIPGLPSFTPYKFSAISPCMCNGAATTPVQQQGPLWETIINQGGSGPNIYNYASGNTNTGGGLEMVFA